MMRALAAGLIGLVVAAAILVSRSSYFDAGNLTSLFSTVVAERGIAVRRGVAYGPDARHRLDVYNAGESDVVILFLYGGGWRSGDRSTYGFVGAALADRGFTTVIPDYRLYPAVEFPAFVEDGARAYRWTAEYIAEGRPIVLMGHSAGAHMAALLALDGRYLARSGGDAAAPAGLIGLAGPYAFDPTTWPSTRDIFAAAADGDEARPVAFVKPGEPPALLMHGLSDDTVRLWNLKRLAAALRKAGSRVITREFEGLGHIGIVTALAQPLRWRAPVLDEIAGFARSLARP